MQGLRRLNGDYPLSARNLFLNNVDRRNLEQDLKFLAVSSVCFTQFIRKFAFKTNPNFKVVIAHLLCKSSAIHTNLNKQIVIYYLKEKKILLKNP